MVSAAIMSKSPKEHRSSTPAVEGAGVPFFEYRKALWKDFQHIEGEVLLQSLIRFVAERAAKISAEEDEPHPDKELIARWKKEGQEAMKTNRTLDIGNREAVDKARKRLEALRAEN